MGSWDGGRATWSFGEQFCGQNWEKGPRSTLETAVTAWTLFHGHSDICFSSPQPEQTRNLQRPGREAIRGWASEEGHSKALHLSFPHPQLEAGTIQEKGNLEPGRKRGIYPIPKHCKKATPQPRVFRLRQQEFLCFVDTSPKAKNCFWRKSFSLKNLVQFLPLFALLL